MIDSASASSMSLAGPYTMVVMTACAVCVALFACSFAVDADSSQGRAKQGADASVHQRAMDEASTPAPRAGHGLAPWNEYIGEVYLFGGCVNMTDTGIFASLAMWRGCSNFSNEVWKMLWEEHSGQISWWRLFSQPSRTTTTTPLLGAASYASARSGSSMVGFYRPSSGSGVTTLFIFGGVGSQYGSTLGDTWFFDTERQRWMAIETEAPPHRAYHSTVHWRDVMIIFGGLQAMAGNFTQYSFRDDTIVFNTTSERWYQFQTSQHAPGHEVWDEKGMRISDASHFQHDQDDTPAPRAHHAASLHPKIPNTMFVHGGVSGTGRAYQDVFLDDVWTLKWQDAESLQSGKITWTKLTPASTTVRPPPIFGHIMASCNGSELTMLWGMTPNKTAPGNAMATRIAWRLDLVHTQWRPPINLYEAARAFSAYASSGCEGWLSDGVSSFGNKPTILDDFQDSGSIP